MAYNPNGIILYRGPSMLDGSPIVVVATGLAQRSTNEKTGALVQTWILRDDKSPTEAVNEGSDSAICGGCRHRGTIEAGRNTGRSCYVTVFQAPLNVYKSVQRGIYAHPSLSEATLALEGRKVRLGSYGDPAAVPASVWYETLRFADGVTGYTHQWKTCDKVYSTWCMASADTDEERTIAKALGYRTFRVRTALEPVMQREVVCPASKEAGYKTNCASCLACGGLTSKAKADIVIMAHGSAGKVANFKRAEAA